MAKAKEAFAPSDTILVMCATGGRGAMAVNLLAQAGFTNVYNIVNGLEGDRIDDPGSVYDGKHLRNGWKNSGFPWGYSFHPDLIWVTGRVGETLDRAATLERVPRGLGVRWG